MVVVVRTFPLVIASPGRLEYPLQPEAIPVDGR